MNNGSIHEVISGRGLTAILFRLARQKASGVLSIGRPQAVSRIYTLQRGLLVVSTRDMPCQRGSHVHARQVGRQLRQLAAEPTLRFRFDGGVQTCPPGSSCKRVALDAWILGYLESSLTSSGAERLRLQLAGSRLSILPSQAPCASHLDATGRRLLDALSTWRRIDELPTAARAPRFRSIAFVFAMREVRALTLAGVASQPLIGTVRSAAASKDAHNILGLELGADRIDVKRAYHRLVRALHPDLQPHLDSTDRERLENKLAEVNRAYRQLLTRNNYQGS